MRKYWESLEKVLRKPWESAEKVLRKASECPGKVLEKSWESLETILRNSWESPEKVLGKSWDNFADLTIPYEHNLLIWTFIISVYCQKKLPNYITISDFFKQYREIWCIILSPKVWLLAFFRIYLPLLNNSVFLYQIIGKILMFTKKGTAIFNKKTLKRT